MSYTKEKVSLLAFFSSPLFALAQGHILTLTFLVVRHFSSSSAM